MARKKLYIAYGSNLNVEQMKRRCPDAEIVGKAELKGYYLYFCGGHLGAVATVEPKEGSTVPVLIWSISKKDEVALDRYEGFPRFYVKKNLQVNVTSLNGEDLGEVSAMVYIMTREAVEMRKINPAPSNYYYSVLDAGYDDFGFDKKILRKALFESFAPKKDCRASQPTTA